MELKTTNNTLEKCILLERVKILKEHMTDKPKEQSNKNFKGCRISKKESEWNMGSKKET